MLQDIVNGINRYAGRITNLAPDSIDETNEKQVLTRLKNAWERDFDDPTTKTDVLAVGTLVRLKIDRGVFYKSYKSQWTDRVYKISAANYTSPITYKIVDNLTSQPLDGKFYKHQLSVLNSDAEV